MLVEINKVIEDGEATNEEMMKISGKSSHYNKLVRGNFNRTLINHMVRNDKKKSAILELREETKLQLHWWVLNLRALKL